MTSKPTHPVELLSGAIATQEGWFVPGSMPSVRHNPGDLRYAGQVGAIKPASVTPPPIATFVSNAAGVTALCRQIWLQVATGQTVREIIAQWAPTTENDTTAYLADVLLWTGLPADTPILDLLPPLWQANQEPRT